MLLILGGIALAGLGVLAWQQHRPLIAVTDGAIPAQAAWDGRLREARLVDVNRATMEELVRLPNIGPALAQRIVAYREQRGSFQSADELQEVPGIGPKTYASLQGYITVEE